MPKYKVFISSVQSEFSKERQLVFDFIRNDELMGQYFEPFIFEQIAAQDANPRQLYLDEASSCQVYLLLIGKKYGNILPDGISPTEKEYQAAGKGNAWRVALLQQHGECTGFRIPKSYCGTQSGDVACRTYQGRLDERTWLLSA